MVRQKFSDLIETAQATGKQHFYQRPYMLPVFGFFIGLAIVLGVVAAKDGQVAHVKESHIVFLYDKGQRQTLTTKAKTVGELINKLPLRLTGNDVVEPSLDTEIVEDNYRVNIYRARPVTIVDDGVKTVALSAQRSARVLAQKAGLLVRPEDEAVFVQGSFKTNTLGEQVAIIRAKPVILSLYGKQVRIYTAAQTVGEMIDDRGVKLAKGDKVLPARETPIKKGLKIYLLRKNAKIKTVEEPIEPPVQSVTDPKLTQGTTAVRQPGEPGKKLVTYQVKVDSKGKVTSRLALQTVVIEKPVPKIIAVGSVKFSGSLEQWLLKLRLCESGGNYKTNTGNGFYGAYQFLDSTWDSLNTGYARADLAPPAVQDQAIIRNTVRSSGGLASQNPGCYRSQGLSQFPPSNR